jgi:hypothetical protein
LRRCKAAQGWSKHLQKHIILGISACILVCAASGCSSSDAPASSTAEKKNFGGGPPPADMQQKIADSQKASSQALADKIAKAKANAMASGKN